MIERITDDDPMRAQYKDHKVEQLWVFVSIDKETGAEGIFAMSGGTDMILPAVATHEKVRDLIEKRIGEIPREFFEDNGQRVVLRHFTQDGAAEEKELIA